MLKIMLVFEKYATLLVEEGIQLGDKMIMPFAPTHFSPRVSLATMSTLEAFMFSVLSVN